MEPRNAGNSTNDARMTGPGELRKEARLSMSIIFNAKTFTKIATWNVRTRYQCGRTEQVIKEMENYKIDLLGVSEMRWTGQGRLNSRGNTVLYSGKEQHHTHGVGIFLSKTAAQTLVSWKPINEPSSWQDSTLDTPKSPWCRSTLQQRWPLIAKKTSSMTNCRA